MILDPNQTVDFVLESYRDTPNPPTFLLKPTSARQAGALRTDLFDSESKETYDAELDRICTVLEPYLKGWKNVQKPFSMDAFKDVCEPNEIYEIGAALCNGVTAQDKKKSD